MASFHHIYLTHSLTHSLSVAPNPYANPTTSLAAVSARPPKGSSRPYYPQPAAAAAYPPGVPPANFADRPTHSYPPPTIPTNPPIPRSPSNPPAAPMRPSHGLTVSELKEMTRARLALESIKPNHPDPVTTSLMGSPVTESPISTPHPPPAILGGSGGGATWGVDDPATSTATPANTAVFAPPAMGAYDSLPWSDTTAAFSQINFGLTGAEPVGKQGGGGSIWRSSSVGSENPIADQGMNDWLVASVLRTPKQEERKLWGGKGEEEGGSVASEGTGISSGESGSAATPTVPPAGGGDGVTKSPKVAARQAIMHRKAAASFEVSGGSPSTSPAGTRRRVTSFESEAENAKNCAGEGSRSPNATLGSMMLNLVQIAHAKGDIGEEEKSERKKAIVRETQQFGA